MKMTKDSLGFLLVEVARLMRGAFAAGLQDSTLTLAQAKLLVHVQRHEGLRQVSLADLLEVKPITAARLIDHLVAAGVIERRPDPLDRRAHLIYLTEGAEPHLAAINTMLAGLRQEMLGCLSEQELLTMTNALLKIRDRLSIH